jgi:hypothetical protein
MLSNEIGEFGGEGDEVGCRYFDINILLIRSLKQNERI